MHCNLKPDDFSSYRQDIKNYRDRFVAHLDSDETMYIPQFDKALQLTQYYYDHVINELKTHQKLNLPNDIDAYYKQCIDESENYFQNMK